MLQSSVKRVTIKRTFNPNKNADISISISIIILLYALSQSHVGIWAPPYTHGL